jgi:predicted MFS family arabinose efflux permease
MGDQMRRLVPVVLGAFALGMDAYVIAGLMPSIGVDLRVSTFAVGLLVTVFTLAYALLSPIGSVLGAGLPARTVLLGALGVFTVGNALSAYAPSLTLLLCARAIAGLGAGVFMPTAAATAAGLVSAARRGRALALITAGMSGGAALGVPIGVMVGQDLGWRYTLWLVTGLGLLACMGVGLTLRGGGTRVASPPLRARFAVLGERGVARIALVTFAASFTSIGAYTYIRALLRNTDGATSTAAYLWVWGVGGMVGCLGIGFVIDVWRDTRMLQTVILTMLALALLTFPVLGRSFVGALAGLFVWGAAGWSSLAPQQHRLLALTTKHGTVAVALNSSALYLGSSAGSTLGGVLVEAHGAVLECLVLGAVAALFALVNRFATPGPKMGEAPGRWGRSAGSLKDPAVGGSAGGPGR